MTDNKCRNFDTCNAPLCPMDERSLKWLWYTTEDLCILRMAKPPRWIKAQRKLRRIKAQGYYTLAMLSHDCIIKRGTEGLNPDLEAEESIQLERWFRDHPAKRELSEEERRAMGEKFSAYREQLKKENEAVAGEINE